MAEQRYLAVLAVIAEGQTVKDVAGRWAVSRQTVHGWLARYEDAGLEGLSEPPRDDGGSEPTKGWGHASTEEVPAGVAGAGAAVGR